MSDTTFQTVRLGRGAHPSPRHGACVVELSSMLAGERFSDHPRSVCRVIAGFLRVYNDRLPEGDLDADELYPIAAIVVGSASTRSVRRARLRRLTAWTEAQDPRRRIGRLAPRDEVVSTAAATAAKLEPSRRGAAVEQLLADLVAMGTAPPAAKLAVPPVAAESGHARVTTSA